ncbi:glycosyltransferase family 9 protein [Winogradskyella aurantiaca]|uniref:glycosyltransferase family 9 protein n=1 Tax=Winogradskyella aurantiaca TaxID=2219558 RepID=UPI001E3A5C1D|nr:glycosyltransferase family 9 protein [Winogradskyella aurantiaca]
MANYRHILVIRFSAMGDVAMTVPVIRAVLDKNPKIRITVLTRTRFTPLFSSIPGIDVIGVNLEAEYKGVSGIFKLARKLKKQRFDAIADLHNVLRTKLLKLLLRGIPFFQLDKGRSEKKELVTGLKIQQLKSTHQRYADVFSEMNIQLDLHSPIFPRKAEIDGFLDNVNIDSKTNLIGIAPFAAHEAKMYPLELMEKVIAELSKTHQLVLFGGGAAESLALSRIEKQFNNVLSVAGNLSFQEELDLISNLDLMISMDSGNGHLAAIYGIPVISVWGVTHPFAGFTPFNQPAGNSLLADQKKYPQIPTSVYGNKFPKGYENAAASIPPEAIIKKVREVLN